MPTIVSRTCVILVSGTYGIQREHAWWRPQSNLAKAIQTRGGYVPPRAFAWTTDLDGVIASRRHRTWSVAGENLWLYVKHYTRPADRVIVIAHSHGGQVAAYSARFGARYDTVITLASPVRADMQDEYQRLSERSRRWVHVYHTGDWTQRFGSWSGLGSMLLARRDVPIATVENRHVVGSHSDLLSEAEWTTHDLWPLIFASH